MKKTFWNRFIRNAKIDGKKYAKKTGINFTIAFFKKFALWMATTQGLPLDESEYWINALIK